MVKNKIKIWSYESHDLPNVKCMYILVNNNIICIYYIIYVYDNLYYLHHYYSIHKDEKAKSRLKFYYIFYHSRLNKFYVCKKYWRIKFVCNELKK